ncbi:MAG: hypothetical protein K2K57_14200 [Oscillospiraceae bacterium]|nr:hypothetical protein [Oscillospiraceae bacterium]
MKNISIRIDKETPNKLHYVADYEARSANGQILILIRENIDDFEKEHGEIEFGKRPSELIRK